MKSKKLLSGLMALSVIISSSLMIGTTAKAAPVQNDVKIAAPVQNNVKMAASPKLEQSQIIKTQSVAITSSTKYVTKFARVPVSIYNYKMDGGYKVGDVVPYFTDADGYSGQLRCLEAVRDSDYDAVVQHLTAGDSYQGYLTYVFGGTVTKGN